MNKTTKESQESSLPLAPTEGSRADSSGSFDAIPDGLTPIVPLLKKSVEHMRMSNGFVKDTNGELIQLNKGVGKLIWWMRVQGLIGFLLIAGLVWSLVALRDLRLRLDQQLGHQAQTNDQLETVVKKLGETYEQGKETKDAIDEQPILTVKPADAADPSSVPTLIVQPKAVRPEGASKSPPMPKGVEIPIDLPPKRK